MLRHSEQIFEEQLIALMQKWGCVVVVMFYENGLRKK
jgi:hypothetical protein